MLTDNEKLKEKFEEYINKYKDDVYRVAYYYSKNEDDAQDLLQDSFARAYRFFHTFRDNSNFKSWIFKIMRNLYISKNKKKMKILENAKNYEITEDKTTSLEDKFLNNITKNELNSAIMLMPQEFKEVIILSDIEGLMYEEISKIIRIPVGTVRSRLHRARIFLKEKLKKKYHED